MDSDQIGTFASLASYFGGGAGGGAGAGAGADASGTQVNPPTTGTLVPGQSPGPGWGTATTEGQGGALNYLGHAALNKAMSGGGTGGQMGGFSDTNGSGGVGSGGSGGYAGGKL